ncbi:DUF3306 domain-containing protein [Limnobacter sp.]|uniref:DUF3306 domain-containing protein n=1 Tax=Limnobacter sp. TaxID=2003368 RepID=UPI0035147BBC
MSDGFLSRWSRRKLEAKTQETQPQAELSSPLAQEGALSKPAPASSAQPEPTAQGGSGAAQVEANLPLPTESDLETIAQGGDIKAFLSDKVSKDLKNKAFKALFSRPEFNVMDGLDIYIDDYNKYTPLSKADIDRMALSKQLLSRPDLEKAKEEIAKIEDADLAITQVEPPAASESLDETASDESKLADKAAEPGFDGAENDVAQAEDAALQQGVARHQGDSSNPRD